MEGVTGVGVTIGGSVRAVSLPGSRCSLGHDPPICVSSETTSNAPHGLPCRPSIGSCNTACMPYDPWGTFAASRHPLREASAGVVCRGSAAPANRPVTAEAKSTFFHIDILPSNNETTTEASTCVFHRGQNQLYAVGYLGNNTTSAAHERTVAGVSTASVRSFLKYRRCSAPPEMLTQKA